MEDAPAPNAPPRAAPDAARRPWIHPTMVAAWAVFFASCAIGYLASFAGIEVRQLVRDPAAEFGIPFWGSAFSTIGLIVLGAASALFASAIKGAPVRLRALLWCGAILMLLLTLDDAFLIHELVGPEILGVPESLFYATYAGLGLVIYGQVRRLKEPALLAATHVAGGFLAFSVSLDVFRVGGPFRYWLEDFTKLSGYVGFLCVAIIAARMALKGNGSDGSGSAR
ncbi:MAG: hypothetical protein AAF618_04770 [Pseudomonadota bacterium]